MDKWESLVDRLVREAIERGEFNGLAGSGQPIDLSENPFEDPELRTVHRLLRNAGFAPAWIEERKDIDTELRRARDMLIRARRIYGSDGRLQESPQWKRALTEFRETAAALNRRVQMYNLKAPAVVFQRKTIDVEGLIRELEADGQ
jgi:DnaJ homolog subfamily C member 28